MGSSNRGFKDRVVVAAEVVAPAVGRDSRRRQPQMLRSGTTYRTSVKTSRQTRTGDRAQSALHAANRRP